MEGKAMGPLAFQVAGVGAWVQGSSSVRWMASSSSSVCSTSRARCVSVASTGKGERGQGQREGSVLGRGMRIGLVSAAVSTALLCGAVSPAAAEQARCDMGVGTGCSALADGNDYIAKLQQRSAENKEKRERALLEDYWLRNYGDYFKFLENKELVKKDDGSWELQRRETPESRAMKSFLDATKK